jgi:rod shape-determining protein MreC
MRRKSPLPYLFPIAVLLVLMTFSSRTTNGMRGFVVASLSPVWESLQKGKSLIKMPFALIQNKASEKEVIGANDSESQNLLFENQQLIEERKRLFEALWQSQAVQDQWGLWRQLDTSEGSVSSLDFIQRRHNELKALLKMQTLSLPALVIFRDPAAWNSSLWVNVGQVNNAALGCEIIAKNSPVIVGTSLVGVIDYVGKKQSRIRLITDSGLTPSVRAVRGNPQNRLMLETIDVLVRQLRINDEKSDISLMKMLEETKKSLKQSQETYYLAKGELRGSSKPLWRSGGQILRGVGFNYDFSDEEGPARDLRTGAPIGTAKKLSSVPILKVNDLLITSGLDGVFPSGLHVAQVTKIYPLREGSYTYELEALPTAGNLNDLSLVFILPPLEFNEEDQPPALGR